MSSPENVDASGTDCLMNEFVAGAIGGMAGLIVGHPMDTVKILMQNSRSNASITCVATSIRQAGLANFFRGLSVPAFTYTVVNAFVFGSYKASLKWLDSGDRPSTFTLVMAGAFSGFVQLIPSVPVEIIKIQQQNNANITTAPLGAFSCVRTIIRNHGLRGLYIGTTMHALRDVPGFAVYFLAYSKLCQLNAFLGMNTFWTSFFAGAVGGSLSWCVSIPFDVIKTRMQSGHLHTASEVLRGLIKERNWRIFFLGFQMVLIRAFFVNGVSFSVYEMSSSWLTRKSHAVHQLQKHPHPYYRHRHHNESRQVAHRQIDTSMVFLL